MLVEQPIAMALLPDESDTTLALGAINFKAPTGNDVSVNAKNGTASGGVVLGDGTAILDGTNGKIDFGDLGNIQEVAMWINPGSTSEQIVMVDTGKTITLVSGTVTYTGLTASATYVNGAASTTLAAGQWQHLVCQFTTTDANNFELGYDGTNYGDVDVTDLRAYTAARSGTAVAVNFAAGVPDSSLVLAVDGSGEDKSRYGLTFANTGGAIIGDRITLNGSSQYLKATTANWRSSDSAGTIRAWVKRAAAGANHCIFATADEAGATKFFSVYFNTSNQIVIAQCNNDTQGVTNTTDTLGASVWARIGIVGTGTAYQAYINGVACTMAGTNDGDWLGDAADRDNVAIGALVRNAGAELAFNGSIDDVRVDSRALSATEMMNDYLQTEGQY